MYTSGKLLLSVLCTALIVLATVKITGMEFDVDHDIVQPIARSRDNGLKVKQVQARGSGALDNQAMETSVEEQYNDDVTDVKAVKYRLQEQRNQLSQALIKLSQQFHQYQCTVATGPRSISSSGGWCPREEENYRTDRDLSVVLVSLFHTGTVAGFGDGGGGYKKKIQAAGLVQRYDSFDGAPFCENITGGSVKYLDLSIPVYGLPLYDWVLSLEVGEHIPKACEHIFLDNIVRHARKGVVLSWAIPGQSGQGHVNSQPVSYIREQLSVRGFRHDANKSEHLQQNTGLSWLRRSINVYFRQNDNPVDMLML